jgi:hypothetical protein
MIKKKTARFHKSLANLNSAAVASKITQKINADRFKPLKDRFHYLLLEGTSDESVLNDFFSGVNCELIPGPHSKGNNKKTVGKKRVKEILHQISTSNQQVDKYVFGIVDMDYDVLIGREKSKVKNLFHCEPNSLETMLWNIKVVRENLVKYLLLKQSMKGSHEEIVSICNKIALSLGVVRLTDQKTPKKGYTLNYQPIANSKVLKSFFYEKDSLNIKSLLNCLSKGMISNQCSFLSSLKTEIQMAPQHLANGAYQYFRGHDIMVILSALTGVSSHHIEKDKLPDYFKIQEFKKTNLYKTIASSQYAPCLKN